MGTQTSSARRAKSLSFALLIIVLGQWASHISRVHADADDVVFLRNGGRARGVVIESDPIKGTRLKLQDGALRVFEAAAVDHVTYAEGNTPPPAAAETRSQPMAAVPEYNALQGALRIESSEPGKVFIEGGEYGSTPLVIPNLSVGQHRVTIRFDAGDDDSRLVSVRGGTETLVSFEATGSLRAFDAHRGWHFGIGLEAGFSMVDDDDAAPEFRAILRGNYAVSRRFELHVDARIGAFGAELHNAEPDQNTTPGVLLGGDAQLNLGSVYTMSVGVDLGVLVGVGGVVGAHISPIGFRMGSERAVLLALQAGVKTSDDDAVATFTLGVTYLFL